MGARKIIVGLVFLAIIGYGLYSILNPSTNTFSGEYISFKYPKDWIVASHDVDPSSSPPEMVVLNDKEKLDIVTVAVFSKNVSLEDVKSNVSIESGGVPEEEGTLDNVRYTKYYSDELRLSFYVFVKDGRVLLVTCNPSSDWTAEDIIKSLNVKK